MKNEIVFLGRIGELSLKGGNRKDFEERLVQNARLFLEGSKASVRLSAGRLYIRCPEEKQDDAVFAISHLTGLAGWARVRTAEKTAQAVTAAVRAEAEKAAAAGYKTFKIEARRADKTFPWNSFEIARETGAAVFQAGILAVDVHRPDVVIMVEIRDQALVYGTENEAPRGLPCGTGGRGLLLLSGGIDSPVAGYRMICRGMKVDSLYFHSHPFTSPEARKKVEDLAAILAAYNIGGHLNVVSFTEVQRRIKMRCPEAFTTVILRICMMKTAARLAAQIGSQAIITGESLGQVASQTMENMAVVNGYAPLPVLRPLIGMDKEEITATAKKIGSYGISILPYEDCCVIFSPKHPVLKAKADAAASILQDADLDPLLDEALAAREHLRISRFGKML